jgi:A/G-specific adenine glycosylase
MDLGATVCVARSPHCLLCPVQAQCVAAREGRPEAYPVKTRKLRRGRREHVWLWLQWRERLWLMQRPPQGIWAGLWSLPEFDSADAFAAATRDWPGQAQPLPSFTHALTHLDWTLHPVRWQVPARTSAARVDGLTASLAASGRWVGVEDALALGLPAPLRRLIG